MVASKTGFILSVCYALGQITLGLLLHPYTTVQSLVRDRSFFWMAVLPLITSLMAKVAWEFGIVPLVQLFFSCSLTSMWLCNAVPFFAHWLLFFCLYWQAVVAYLFIRFALAFRSA